MANSLRLDPTQLAKILQRFPAYSSIKTWVLAYSGGVDSQVLLHLLSQLSLPLRAIYIDHGLQAMSKQWAEQCRQSCIELKIPFESISVDAKARAGESPEAAAREARYAALAKQIEPNTCLITAQHRDDQAETFMLQLLRGAGAAGLSAMPQYDRFHQGWHFRPLLDFSRQDILHYAHTHALKWVDDPSNQDIRFDRNYLRHQIMPTLVKRWPSVSHTLTRSAQQQAENQQLLDVLALQDIGGDADSKLPVDILLSLDEPRQRNALRYWFAQHHVRMPSRAVMQQIIDQMLYARDDAMPNVQWDAIELHRFKNMLYLVRHLKHDPSVFFDWDGNSPLQIPSLQSQLSLLESDQGLCGDLCGKSLQVRFRQGGERIKPAGQKHTHEMKKLFQQAEVPPWLRDRIPLLYLNDELIAVCGYWLADKYTDKTGKGLIPVLSSD